MKFKRQHILTILAIAFTLACAQVVAPTGGEKDITPPEILLMEPQNEALNFSGNEIVLSFDEFVKVQKLKEQLIISPPLKYSLITKVKGKQLTIEIQDTLKENTTYVMNFGNSIVDVRENNPIPNFTIVFSTGNEIDSLSVSGRIINSFDAKVEKDVLFMLYKENIDSIPLLELPIYIARTDEEGLFTVSNVKAGTYKVFALKDANTNYIYDRPTELIAFDTLELEIKENIDRFNMYLFQEDKELQYVKDISEKGSNIILNYNRKFDTTLLSGLDTNLSKILKKIQIGHNQDSVSLWFNQMNKEQINLVVSDGIDFTDTIKFRVDSSYRKLKVETLSGSDFFKPIKLGFRTPVAAFDTAKIQIYGPDSILIPFTANLSENQSKLIIDFEKQQVSAYQLFILPETFQDIYGKTNDTLQKSIQLNTERDFGNLKINLNSTLGGPKIIQLLNNNGDVLRETPIENAVVDFKYLKPGKYRLKCILDKNGNGQWDTGEYLTKLMPEKVILFDEEISIRSNWDKEINWNIEL